MKKKLSMLSLLGAIAILIGGAIILSSCEGPEGPAGADGTNGIDGVAGTDGTDGVAGNAVCLECHTMAVKDAVNDLWAASLHGTSQQYYPGSPTLVQSFGVMNGCAKCHTAEGFIETVWTGQDTTAMGIPLPSGVRCKACHDFHSSLDFENEPNHAIRQTMAVTLIAGGDVVEFTNAESNLCMNCHQAEHGAPDDAVPTAIVVVEEHWGPHHGPQANFINGYVGYEFGVVLSTSGPHESGASCVSCHMAEVVGDTTGGHTFMPGLVACLTCHPSATDFDVNGAVTVIAGLLDELEAALFAAGMVDDKGHATESQEEDLDADPPEPEIIISYEADVAGALWNYILLEEDASMGIHNPDYATALLTNSINALTAK